MCAKQILRPTAKVVAMSESINGKRKGGAIEGKGTKKQRKENNKSRDDLTDNMTDNLPADDPAQKKPANDKGNDEDDGREPKLIEIESDNEGAEMAEMQLGMAL